MSFGINSYRIEKPPIEYSLLIKRFGLERKVLK